MQTMPTTWDAILILSGKMQTTLAVMTSQRMPRNNCNFAAIVGAIVLGEIQCAKVINQYKVDKHKDDKSNESRAKKRT